jgi:nuclear control of ATPase protein 2
LDHMLRDIGYGNGRPSTRGEALKKAQFAYTLALRSGVMRNLVTGKLIRLLLIQIQQLKVVALSAVGRIDVILKGNQLNFRILAAVPAIVGAIYLLRFLWRILYNIRSQDLRPVTAAHQDMAIFLEKIERGILCMDEDDQDSSTGEIVLYIHRYLLLLDFSTPPFPTKISDEIAESLHSLDARVSSKEDQRLLLRRIQRMHQQLGETL